MKKFFLMFAALGVLFTSCQYDDTALSNRIDALDERLSELEETVRLLNEDIAGVETLVNALNENVYVSKIVEGETGYEVYFTNGDKITIANGKDGEAGKDGVTVTVMLGEDGLYYWAVEENGVCSFIEVDGKRLPVKGEKGNTPQMRVVMEGETGYWEVSYDNGETWERVLLADGTPVTTSGGAGGLFKEAYVDEETNTAVFVFLNGETLEIELRSDLYINFKGEALESADFRYGETRTFEMEAVGVLKAIVTTPDEWDSSFDKETGIWSITAPSAEHADCADLDGEVALIYFGEENQSSVITLNVAIGQYVTVADEYLTIAATAEEAVYEVPFTADGEVTIEAVDAWISGVAADGIASITVAASEGAERSGTIKLVAKSNEVVITVNQGAGVELQAYGYRAGSETTQFAVSLSEITDVAAATADHIAVTNDYVIISSPNTAPVAVDALTGEYVATLDLGELAGLNAAVTADDANNIIVSTYQESTGFRVARMKSIYDTPEVFITHSSIEYGKDISVVGDVYGDARVTLMYSPWSSGTTGHLLFTVSGGVADGGYWSNIAAGDITIKYDNNNGDVIYRDMGEGAPYFMTGYSSNCFVWAEGGTALATQATANSNCGAVCIDVEKFNGAYYLMTACDTYFTWSLPDAGVYLADVTTIDNFNAGTIYVSTGAFEWNAASTGGNTDCGMKVSEDGVYMYVYVLHPNAKLGCIRVDCLANAPLEQ